MKDIVERLRAFADRERPYGRLPDALDEAAAEIERLRAALEGFVKPGGADDFWQCFDIARAALEDRT